MQEDKKKLIDLFFSEEWDAVIPTHLSCVLPFLSEQTFHIFAEYAYAKAVIENDENINFWRDIYEHIQQYYHLNNPIESFDNLIKSMQKYGFDCNYPIPVDTNYHIIDGSHRLSVSMALGITPYVYMCKKQSELFPKKNFSILNARQIKALNNVYNEIMQNFRITFENKCIFYLAGRELDFWNDIVQNEAISQNSCFFIYRFPFAVYQKIVRKSTGNPKNDFKILGIIITNLTQQKIKRILPATYPYLHSSIFLTQNIKKYCKFIK